jgi:hypothetical protein
VALRPITGQVLLFHEVSRLHTTRGPQTTTNNAPTATLQPPRSNGKTTGSYCRRTLPMMDEDLPETCWATHKRPNNKLVKLMHLVIWFIWIVWWCTDLRTSIIFFEVTYLTLRRRQTFEVEGSKSKTLVGYVLGNGRNSSREKKLASEKVQFDLALKCVKCLSVCRLRMQFVNFYHYNLSFLISEGLAKCLPYILSWFMYFQNIIN